MANSNKRKDELLGEPHGTANGRLRKMLIFDLAGRLGLLGCYRCGQQVETLETFSVEHKEPWQRAANPRASFFDLNNIAFSHLRCNVIAGDGNRLGLASQAAQGYPTLARNRTTEHQRVAGIAGGKSLLGKPKSDEHRAAIAAGWIGRKQKWPTGMPPRT